MFPIQQCRVHALVGTPADVRAYFGNMAQSNDTSQTQSNDMSQPQSNNSPAQSNGLGAAPGDLRLTILYSPHPEPSLEGGHGHRAGTYRSIHAYIYIHTFIHAFIHTFNHPLTEYPFIISLLSSPIHYHRLVHPWFIIVQGKAG